MDWIKRCQVIAKDAFCRYIIHVKVMLFYSNYSMTADSATIHFSMRFSAASIQEQYLYFNGFLVYVSLWSNGTQHLHIPRELEENKVILERLLVGQRVLFRFYYCKYIAAATIRKWCQLEVLIHVTRNFYLEIVVNYVGVACLAHGNYHACLCMIWLISTHVHDCTCMYIAADLCIIMHIYIRVSINTCL